MDEWIPHYPYIAVWQILNDTFIRLTFQYGQIQLNPNGCLNKSNKQKIF